MKFVSRIEDVRQPWCFYPAFAPLYINISEKSLFYIITHIIYHGLIRYQPTKKKNSGKILLFRIWLMRIWSNQILSSHQQKQICKLWCACSIIEYKQLTPPTTNKSYLATISVHRGWSCPYKSLQATASNQLLLMSPNPPPNWLTDLVY